MSKKPSKTESIDTDSTTDKGSVSIIITLVCVIGIMVTISIIVFVICFLEQIKSYELASISTKIAIFVAGAGTPALLGKGLHSIKKFIQK